MGLNQSTLTDIRNNKLVAEFAGVASIDEDAEFWSEFFSFSYVPPLHRDNDKHFYESLYPFMMDLVKNNLKSQNFYTLIKIFIKDATLIQGELKNGQSPNLIILKKATNNLFIFRCCVKFLIQNYSEKDVMKHFIQHTSYATKSAPLSDYMFYLLFSLLVDMPVGQSTFHLMLECISTLIIMMSSQLCQPLSTEMPAMYQYVFWGKSVNLANQIVGKLLKIFAMNEKPPSNMIVQQSGMIWNAATYLASGLLSIVTFGYVGGKSSSSTSQSPSPAMFSLMDLRPESLAQAPLDITTYSSFGCNLMAKQAAHLLLLLITQASVNLPSKGDAGKRNSMRNPYREAFFALKSKNIDPDLQVNQDNLETAFDFDQLSKAFQESARLDSTVLILYLMVHRNGHFRNLLLKDSKNYEKYLMPILGILFKSSVDCSNLVYMSLIIVLILSENDKFTQNIHDIAIKKIFWLLPGHDKELANQQPPANSSSVNGTADHPSASVQGGSSSSATSNHDGGTGKQTLSVAYSPAALSDISLGSLIFLCLLKTIQRHLFKLKDKYLHINCLAALANLSSRMKRLHPSACKLLLELINVMMKKREKSADSLREVKDKLRTMKEIAKKAIEAGEEPDGSLEKELLMDQYENIKSDLELIEEILRMMLEILNSTLIHSLPTNSDLVYSLLYNKAIFSRIRGVSTFQDIVQNLDAIINYFSYKIDKNLNGNPTSSEAVLSLISKNVDNLEKSQNLRRSPELKFKYVEESSPDEFFLPYVWWLIYLNGMDFFNGCSAGLLASSSR